MGYHADSENDKHNPASGAPGADVTDASAVFAYLDDTIVAVPPEFAEAALNAAIEIFARHGHTVHPGKSACWSLSTASNVLPPSCQRIWSVNGLLVGGIPVYNESEDPILAREKLSEIVAKARREAEFLVRIIYDDQVKADAGWCCVQSTLLILRYSLATK